MNGNKWKEYLIDRLEGGEIQKLFIQHYNPLPSFILL